MFCKYRLLEFHELSSSLKQFFLSGLMIIIRQIFRKVNLSCQICKVYWKVLPTKIWYKVSTSKILMPKNENINAEKGNNIKINADY